METYTSCPNCGGGNLFAPEKNVSAGGGYAPNYLPGLGGVFSAEKFRLVLCADCGLTRFFASKAAREKLRETDKWKRV